MVKMNKTTKSPVTKRAKKGKGNIKSVYGDETIGAQNKRFHFVHYILKYRIVLPMALKFERFVLKKHYREPTLPQHEYVKLWESVFDESNAQWQHKYLQSLNPKKEKKSLSECREVVKANKGKTTKWLNLIKKSGSLLFMNDDSYMEWLPFFMYECYKQMGANLKDKAFNKRAHHLLHTVPKSLDPDYELIYLHLKTVKNFEVSPLGKQGKTS